MVKNCSTSLIHWCHKIYWTQRVGRISQLSWQKPRRVLILLLVDGTLQEPLWPCWEIENCFLSTVSQTSQLYGTNQDCWPPEVVVRRKRVCWCRLLVPQCNIFIQVFWNAELLFFGTHTSKIQWIFIGFSLSVCWNAGEHMFHKQIVEIKYW